MIYYICNVAKKEKSKGDHCLMYCKHGRPHKADGCTSYEECDIECGIEKEDGFYHDGIKHTKKAIMVKCRPVTKSELTFWKKYLPQLN